MKIELWKTNWQEGGWVTDEVSTIPSYKANTCEENRIKFVTDCAAISRGKAESNNSKKRYEALLKEAAPNWCNPNCSGVAGRPLEFLPVVLRNSEVADIIFEYLESKYGTDIGFANYILPFSYLDNYEDILYTNMRTLLNAGIPYEMIPYNTEEELKNFKVVKIKAPYFIFAQCRTHCKISQIASSARVIKEDEIWFPEDLLERLLELYYGDTYFARSFMGRVSDKKDDSIVDDFIEDLKENWYLYTTLQLQDLLRESDYKREIWQRYPTHALYKQWVMAGWKNDPKVWNHFFLERGVFEDKYRNWVQPETKEVAKTIYQIIGDNKG